MSFAQVLLNLQGPWINAAVGILLSFVAERWPAYAALPPKDKRLLMLVACLLIPGLAALTAIAGGYQSPGWDATTWPALFAGLLSFSATTIAHTRKLA